ncbi:MAG: transaldolase family protein [archaeon]|nr:transaldolase family protein [archaeon]
MKLFIDSASTAEIEDCLKKGAIQGITTNPSIISKEPKTDFVEHVKKIVSVCKKFGGKISLSMEVTSEKAQEMEKEAIDYAERIKYSDLYIKIPLTGWDELETIKNLTSRGINVNCTCLFNEAQCLLAAYAGASYVSLFRGRMRDAGIESDQVISNTRRLLEETGLPSEIIAGSIRGPRDVIDSFLAGAHIVTVGVEHIKKMATHLKSKESADQFLSDFRKWTK